MQITIRIKFHDFFKCQNCDVYKNVEKFYAQGIFVYQEESLVKFVAFSAHELHSTQLLLLLVMGDDS